MKIYLLTINSSQIFYPDSVHRTVIKDQSIDAWWHYLPNIWLLRTSQNAKYHADRVISVYPGLNFLITKIDLNEYNGYLPQAAWDWIKAHYKKPATYKELPKSPLLDVLTSRPPTLPPSTSISLDDLLKKK